MTHSLAINMVLQDKSRMGTLFVSDSNCTFFVERVGLANVVSNTKDVEGQGAWKQLKTMITFDDGTSLVCVIYSSSNQLQAAHGPRFAPHLKTTRANTCDPPDTNLRSLHPLCHYPT